MANPWFRLYNEIIDDKKIRLLAFEDRWHYVALLCLKNSGDLDRKKSLLDQIVSIGLGIHGADLVSVKKRLMEVGLIDSNWQPLAWDTRQFKSDSSTARVRRHRENAASKGCNGNETLHGRFSNGPETETEEETDTEKDKREIFPDWLDQKAWQDFRAYRRAGKGFTKRAEQLCLTKLAEVCPNGKDHVAVINQSIERGWKSFFPIKRDSFPNQPNPIRVTAEQSKHPALVYERQQEAERRRIEASRSGSGPRKIGELL